MGGVGVEVGGGGRGSRLGLLTLCQRCQASFTTPLTAALWTHIQIVPVLVGWQYNKSRFLTLAVHPVHFIPPAFVLLVYLFIHLFYCHLAAVNLVRGFIWESDGQL